MEFLHLFDDRSCTTRGILVRSMLDHLFSRIPADATFTPLYCRPIAGILPIAWLLSASRAEMFGTIAPNIILATLPSQILP
ncbi:hypothetical protein [Blastochloris tepida]|uniref:hypothetical protein n=1 Tax=Blastochloris tepida TaxID=2233851 RepID=UPI000F84BC31|nr:hypothetical protein [Blastochloris tepida]